MKSNYGRNIAIGLAVILALGAFVSLGMFSFNNEESSITGQNQIAMTNDNINTVSGRQNVLPNGLSITDTVVGTGVIAESGMAVAVHYTGTLPDGTVFDSSYTRGEPIQFLLGKGMVIPGWDQGIVGMKVGGKRHLVIPAALAYGPEGIKDPSTGKYVIPQNATLIFDTELIATAKIDPKTGQVIQ